MTERKIEVVYRPIDSIAPYAKNARMHSEAQVDEIVASINEFGWTNPVLIDEQGGIIAGHGRAMAARKLGLAEVPCVVLTGLTKAQRRAYLLADNKLALNASWDKALLAQELDALKMLEFNIDVIGFSGAEVEKILSDYAKDIAGPTPPEGAKELDPDGYEFDHRCPKCGFEFSDTH